MRGLRRAGRRAATPFRDGLLPGCAVKNDDYDRARSHLSALITPAVAAWRRHWLDRGMQADLLVEMLENSDDLVDIVQVLNGRDNPKADAALVLYTFEVAA